MRALDSEENRGRSEGMCECGCPGVKGDQGSIVGFCKEPQVSISDVPRTVDVLINDFGLCSETHCVAPELVTGHVPHLGDEECGLAWGYSVGKHPRIARHPDEP